MARTRSSEPKTTRTRASTKKATKKATKAATNKKAAPPPAKPKRKAPVERKKLPKPYQKLVVEAIREIASPTGSSQIAIEHYIQKTYEGTVVSRTHLKNAINTALESNLIEHARGHKNSFKLKNSSSSAAASSRAALTPRARTSRTSRAAAITAPTPTFSVPPSAGPVANRKWQYALNNKCFGLFIDKENCVAADESGLVAQLSHDGDLQKVWKLDHGVKCLVSDSGYLFAGCNNGALYDLTSGVPRLVAQLEDFSEIFWLDMYSGRMVASDRSGHVALLNFEGETVWQQKSSGSDGWMVRVDEEGIYHGHSKGITKYSQSGKQLWHTETMPVLFGWQEEKHIYAALVDPGCFDGEIAKRLSREGAKTGEVVASLMWDTTDDLDLHVFCPCGNEISFMNKQCQCGGELDVDMNTAFNMSNEPVENIFYANAPKGHFKVTVIQYTNRSGKAEVPFEVCVKVKDEVHRFQKVVSGCGMASAVNVFEFDFEPSATTASSSSDNAASSSSDAKELKRRGVVKLDKETGEIVAYYDAASSVPSVTCSGSNGTVFAAVANSVKCFNDDGSFKWHLWTDAGSPMSMQFFEEKLFAVCTNKLVCIDVSEEAAASAVRGQGKLQRSVTHDSSGLEEVTALGENDLETTNDTSQGVIVEVVEEGGKLRVRPKPGQARYSSAKNVQFPRNIRKKGAQFVVGGLVLVGSTFYRVVGEIKKLTPSS